MCYHFEFNNNNNNNNNNNWFYIALFLLRSKRYPGHRIQNQFCTQSAISKLPGEHSGQSPFYRRAHANPTVRILYRVPIYTSGSRAAMWIKCLAEGQKYRATVDVETGLSAWESSGHTTIPRHLRWTTKGKYQYWSKFQCQGSTQFPMHTSEFIMFQCVQNSHFPLHFAKITLSTCTYVAVTGWINYVKALRYRCV